MQFLKEAGDKTTTVSSECTVTQFWNETRGETLRLTRTELIIGSRITESLSLWKGISAIKIFSLSRKFTVILYIGVF